MMTALVKCEACNEAIFDRFKMRVGQSDCHEKCLFCADCSEPLVVRCFYKKGLCYCKACYGSRFGNPCGGCGHFCYPKDSVIRTRFSIYHVACFRCSVCGRGLNPGEQFRPKIGQVTILEKKKKSSPRKLDCGFSVSFVMFWQKKAIFSQKFC